MHCCHTSCELMSPGEQKRYRHLIRDTSRRPVSLSRSNRAAILAKKKLNLALIEEAEEYIESLRQKCALLNVEVLAADDEVANVRGILNQKGIAECSLSDQDDDDGVPLYPPSTSNLYSDYIKDDNDYLSSSSGSYLFHYGDEDVDSTLDKTQREGEYRETALADEVVAPDAKGKGKMKSGYHDS